MAAAAGLLLALAVAAWQPRTIPGPVITAGAAVAAACLLLAALHGLASLLT